MPPSAACHPTRAEFPELMCPQLGPRYTKRFGHKSFGEDNKKGTAAEHIEYLWAQVVKTNPPPIHQAIFAASVTIGMPWPGQFNAGCCKSLVARNSGLSWRPSGGASYRYPALAPGTCALARVVRIFNPRHRVGGGGLIKTSGAPFCPAFSPSKCSFGVDRGGCES
jgi:hypothetical protein